MFERLKRRNVLAEESFVYSYAMLMSLPTSIDLSGTCCSNDGVEGSASFEFRQVAFAVKSARRVINCAATEKDLMMR
jgi:hypothetical protein